MKDLDYGKNYRYAHSYENNFVAQEFFPDELAGTQLYTPQNNRKEQEYRKYLAQLWKNKYGY
jgi:putative ATPase